MFVVVGATGNTGSAVADTLLSRKQPVRIVVRSAEKGTVWKAKGAEVAVASSMMSRIDRKPLNARSVYSLAPTYGGGGCRPRARGPFAAAVNKSGRDVVFSPQRWPSAEDGTDQRCAMGKRGNSSRELTILVLRLLVNCVPESARQDERPLPPLSRPGRSEIATATLPNRRRETIAGGKGEGRRMVSRRISPDQGAARWEVTRPNGTGIMLHEAVCRVQIVWRFPEAATLY